MWFKIRIGGHALYVLDEPLDDGSYRAEWKHSGVETRVRWNLTEWIEDQSLPV